MRLHLINKLCFILLTLMLFSPVNAAIIDNGTYTTDTQTGLDWLDVTETFQRSYNDVSSQFGVGGEFEGWRYATMDELLSLIFNASGIIIPEEDYNLFTNVEDDQIDPLVAYLGSTLDLYWPSQFGDSGSWDSSHGFEEGAGLDETTGMVADINGNGSPMYVHLHDKDYAPNSRDGLIIGTNSSLDMNSVDGLQMGSFLVRESGAAPISEPSILLLFGVAFVGFGLFRSKK